MRSFFAGGFGHRSVGSNVGTGCSRAPGAAGLQGAAEQLRITEPVAQVCREVCRENVCRTRCVNERDRDEVRSRAGPSDRDEHRDRRPGVELNVPGVNIEARTEDFETR